MKIAMIASEINPVVKSGGLADVVYSLSKELTIIGEEVICVLPYYLAVDRDNKVKVKRIGEFDVSMSWRKQKAVIYRTYIDGIAYYLIDNEYYFWRDNLYGYHDDGERFAFFSLAASQLLEFVDFQADVVHLHDWQVGMVPCIIKNLYKGNPFYSKMKFAFTIHNPFFQGNLDRYFLNNFYGLPDSLFDDGSVRFNDQVSTLKSGIVFSDKITTVSPNHAKELLTPEGGKGLEGVLRLREKDFSGIVNGIDTAEFDPRHDPFIYRTFGADDFQIGKKADRKALLDACGLHDNGGPLFGFVSRLTFQKGIDLIIHDAPTHLRHGAMIIALGSGEYELEQGLEELRSEFPEQVGIYIGYNNKRAHEIYAGLDFFLMPSLFEPCGIGQMIALRYGTIPLVRDTGGLRDTVIGYDGKNADKADGIIFEDYDDGGLMYASAVATKLYEDKKSFNKIITNAMKADHSWKKSAEAYIKLYKSLIA